MYNLYFKRFFDFFVAFILLFLLLPLLLTLYILVKIKIGSPVFFLQTRPGKHNKPFKMVKFRSMTNAKDAKGNLLSNQKRLTKFGAVLRTTSLDELPELFNVLRGEMSFVGPRPLLMDYLPYFTSEESKRHFVKPGITGWAQVNGRNAISWPEKLKLDVWYVENQSFILDIRILLLTLKKVIARDSINHSDGKFMPRFDDYVKSKLKELDDSKQKKHNL